MLTLSRFRTTQRWIKGAIAMLLGSFNLAGIWFAIHLIQTHALQALLHGLSLWLMTPIPFNALGLLQGILSLLIILLTWLIDLILWLITFGHASAGLIHLITTLGAALLAAINQFSAPWMTIAILPPAQLIPFAKSLIDLIAASDSIAAILLSTLITLFSTSLTLWIFSLDIPRYLARRLNERRAQRAYRQWQELEKTLSQINLYELPPEETESLRMLATLLLQARQRSNPNWQFTTLPFNPMP